MPAPEHSSHYTNNNYTKNEKETSITSIDKNLLSDRRLSDTIFFNNLDVESLVRSALAESTRPEQLYIRVKRSIKVLYTLLSSEQKKLLRDMVENAVVQFFTNKQLFEQKSVVVNISVQQVLKGEDVREANIVKLKRELEKLREELAKATSENVDLRNELEKLKRQRDELQRQLQQLQQMLSKQQPGQGKLLEDALFALAVVSACIEVDCSRQKLLEFIKREYEKLLQHVNPPRAEIVGVYVKHLKE